jgi:hypothetical protein
MDNSKIEAIRDRVHPTNVKQLQQFLGICNYYRRFVKDFAKMAYPLNELLRGDEIWVWDERRQKAFEDLKQALMSYPILRQPDFSRKFTIFTDASGYALGAVLTHDA